MSVDANRMLFIDAVARSAPGCGGSHRFSAKQFLSVRGGRPEWVLSSGAQYSYLDIDGTRADPEPYAGVYVANPLGP